MALENALQPPAARSHMEGALRIVLAGKASSAPNERHEARCHHQDVEPAACKADPAEGAERGSPPCTLNWGYMVPNSGYLGPNRG